LSLSQAEQVSHWLKTVAHEPGQRIGQQLAEFTPLVKQVIEQTVARVLNGQSLPAAAKLVSLCEPHTQILRRGKAKPHDTEFGHKVNFAEVEHGLISHWQVIGTGNPPDARLLPAALTHHTKTFGHPPNLLAGDRGLFSPENESLAEQLGVQHIALPKPGYRSTERQAHEQQTWFKDGQRFRNGIEGRISVVRRTVQLKRCPYHGLDGFERWIGWGVFVANLVTMARLIHRRSNRKRHHKT